MTRLIGSRLVQLMHAGIVMIIACHTASASVFDYFEWKEINEGSTATWEARAGLQAVRHGRDFLVLGGRSPRMFPMTFGDSDFYNDVWQFRFRR